MTPQSGCCRRRVAVAESDGIQSKGYTSRAERSAGFTKTRLCKFYQEGNCTRGKKCTFAHGEVDQHLQSQPVGMKLCKTLIATGRCKNQNCRYAHSKEQIVAAKQLTTGLVDGQEPDVGPAVTPSDHTFNSQANVRWGPLPLARAGFALCARWVCPLRAQQRLVVAPPPGVFEPPLESSAAISYPAMQMVQSEPLAPQQAEDKCPSEPAFQVVVKNTFIDIVETSPRSASRSQSEPPRERFFSAVGDMAELEEQQCPVTDSVPETTTTPAAPMAEPSFTHEQQVSDGILMDAPLPVDVVPSIGCQQSQRRRAISQAKQLTHEPHLFVSDSTVCVMSDSIPEINTTVAANAADLFFIQPQQDSVGIPTGSTHAAEDVVDSGQAQPQHKARSQSQQSTHGQLLCFSGGTVDVTQSPVVIGSSVGEQSAFYSRALPAFKVRNTFIEVCHSLLAPEGLRRVRSAAGRLDQLVTEVVSTHHA